MNIIWSPGARRHLHQIEVFIGKDNPQAATAMANRIIEASERLLTFPDRGRAGRVPHTRELVVTGTPFILPYQVRDGVVEIIGVFHGAQNWPES